MTKDQIEAARLLNDPNYSHVSLPDELPNCTHIWHKGQDGNFIAGTFNTNEIERLVRGKKHEIASRYSDSWGSRGDSMQLDINPPNQPIAILEANKAADNYKWRAQASALFMWIASRAQDAQGPKATDLDRAAAVADIRRAATEWMLHGRRPKELDS